jgi:hypothetical protein
MGEQVLGVALDLAESDTLVGVESSGEIISTDNSENSLVDVEIDTNVQVTPQVVF